MNEHYNIFGYVRVSSRDQNEARQVMAMREWGVDEKKIYIDKLSGKNFERPAYQKMLSKMKKGDLLLVQSIDRLGRNYTEILEQWRIITKERGLNIRVLDMDLLDTTKGRDLLGMFIADLVLQLLSFVAEMERNSIKQRQAEGIAVAKANGVKFGRPQKQVPSQFEVYKNLWLTGQITSRMAATKLSVSHPTFIKWVRASRI